MAYNYNYTSNNNLGNNLQEIQFFSKDVDYDKVFYDTHVLKKDMGLEDCSASQQTEIIRLKDLIRIWEEGGSIKVLCLADFDAYPLYFTNFQNYDYDKLKEFLGNFFTLRESEKLECRATYKNEEDLRTAYRVLKKDSRYQVQVYLDIESYRQQQKNYVKQNNGKNKNYLNIERNQKLLNDGKTWKFNNNGRARKLINEWLIKGDVVCETSKENNYPVLINNYKHLNYDELVELFSKFGKFISITHLENKSVQVKFRTEDEARNCYKYFDEDKSYNVRLLFFLKELNTTKKLIKDVVPSKEAACLNRLFDTENKIKFCPNQSLNKNQHRKHEQFRYRNNDSNDTHNKTEKRKNMHQIIKGNLNENGSETENISDNERIVFYSRKGNNGNVYVEGIPYHNPFITPPHSYKVWRSKQNHLPPLITELSREEYISYINSMKDNRSNSRHESSYEDDR